MDADFNCIGDRPATFAHRMIENTSDNINLISIAFQERIGTVRMPLAIVCSFLSGPLRSDHRNVPGLLWPESPLFCGSLGEQTSNNNHERAASRRTRQFRKLRVRHARFVSRCVSHGRV